MPIAEKTAEEANAIEAEPTWEIAHLFPYQGAWSEDEYLALDTNHLVEFDHGYLEVLPMPGILHQRIVLYLYRVLWAFVTTKSLGEALTAPLPVQLWSQKYREPDILFFSTAGRPQPTDKYAIHPDLVMEVVSPDDPDRDYVKKRAEYARAGIPEYWIVDALQKRITVLTLAAEEYEMFGEFTPGMRAASQLLPGFSLAVDDVLAAAD
ncbi:MAG TPA: Uma2 family endonuclease [Caldilineaceae bacterium]|nr:Uma2 family endonuclease [Caldilineaceae bacterium]